ncbi:DUF4198 domain-containing protein [Chryseolinea lacunae]|uniref:DUF4198 domain-containing protein n=1 Tax=Chryseolinea lacunae TaxID=2801331 RepID=A0ABS1KXG2_9BACT|nr:DUF4198 domain-containing protein [Chryseolinea lacunae]MBL0743907.1 hypothetical protein [Chryseolinea lacunae]
MRQRLYLIALLIFAHVSAGFAHALWIETKGEGILGKEQEVKIFYGEYAEKEFEATDKWYSDVNTFALWLTTPDGTKKQLTYKSADKAFVASFTPDKEGTYVLTVGHSAREIDGTTVYQFNASAVVAVKSSTIGNAKAIPANELYLEPGKDAKGKQGIVKAFYKGQPAAKITITVSTPSGWSKNFHTDENGVANFELQGKGWYALEGFYTTEEKGNHFDKPYESIWRCATLRIDVK